MSRSNESIEDLRQPDPDPDPETDPRVPQEPQNPVVPPDVPQPIPIEEPPPVDGIERIDENPIEPIRIATLGGCV